MTLEELIVLYSHIILGFYFWDESNICVINLSRKMTVIKAIHHSGRNIITHNEPIRLKKDRRQTVRTGDV